MKLCQKCTDAIQQELQLITHWDLGGTGMEDNPKYIAQIVPESDCEFWAHQALLNAMRDIASVQARRLP